jgi:hypothetical protein
VGELIQRLNNICSDSRSALPFVRRKATMADLNVRPGAIHKRPFATPLICRAKLRDWNQRHSLRERGTCCD